MPEAPAVEEGFRFEQWFIHEGRKYPVRPMGFLEPPVVERLTGLRFPDWSERMDDLDPEVADPMLVLGMIGAAVAQRYPKWEIDKICRFVRERANDNWVYHNNLPETDEEEDEEPEDDADSPPSEEVDPAADGSTSTEKSETPPDSTSDTNQSSTTPPGSPTTSPESESETSE